MEDGFRIGDLQVDVRAGQVSGPKGRERLDPPVMRMLIVLGESAGKVVSREELLAQLAPDVVASDDELTGALHELRGRMSAAAGSDHYRALIETIPKRGYRLNATITPIIVPPPGTGVPARSTGLVWIAVTLAALVLAWLAWTLISAT